MVVFINMVNQLAAKNCKNISHIEVPTYIRQQGGGVQTLKQSKVTSKVPEQKKERKSKAEK